MTPETRSTASDRSHFPRFDLAHLPLRRTFEVVQAADHDLPSAIEVAGEHFPHVKDLSAAVWRVHRRSRSILVAHGEQGVVGTAALLCLNQEGLTKLRSDTFSVTAPDDALLTRSGEIAVAVYVWLLCLPGARVSAMGQMMRWLQRNGLAGCDLYACAGSAAGERFMRKTGFGLVGTSLCGRLLWVYSRSSRPILSAED